MLPGHCGSVFDGGIVDYDNIEWPDGRELHRLKGLMKRLTRIERSDNDGDTRASLYHVTTDRKRWNLNLQYKDRDPIGSWAVGAPVRPVWRNQPCLPREPGSHQMRAALPHTRMEMLHLPANSMLY